MAQLKLSKVSFLVQQMINQEDASLFPLLTVQTSARIVVSPKMQHPIGFGEGDLRFKADELSPEGQGAVKLLLAELEAKAKAVATKKAQEIAADSGITLED